MWLSGHSGDGLGLDSLILELFSILTDSNVGSYTRQDTQVVSKPP